PGSTTRRGPSERSRRTRFGPSSGARRRRHEASEPGCALRRRRRLRVRVPVPPDLLRRGGQEGPRRAQGRALARRGREGGADVQGVCRAVEARLPGAEVMGDFEVFLGGILVGAILAFGLLFVALLVHEWIAGRPDRIRARRRAISDAYSSRLQKTHIAVQEAIQERGV